MERTVSIGDTEVRMRASALIPRLYRYKFSRDMIVDMNRLINSATQINRKRSKGEQADFSLEDLTIFENAAYIMAKHADPSLPEDVDEWLDGMDGVLSVYQALPQILELWGLNQQTTSVPRKK